MSYLYFPGRICSWQGRLTEETGSAGEEGNSTSRASQHLRHPQPTARAIHHHEQRGLLPHLRQRVNATEGSGVCQRRRPRPPRRRVSWTAPTPQRQPSSHSSSASGFPWDSRVCLQPTPCCHRSYRSTTRSVSSPSKTPASRGTSVPIPHASWQTMRWPYTMLWGR